MSKILILVEVSYPRTLPDDQYESIKTELHRHTSRAIGQIVKDLSAASGIPLEGSTRT